MHSQPSPRIELPAVPDALLARLKSGDAVAWSEPISIPTYEPGEPSNYPMYLDNRVYQGSSGRVYPLPITERISRTPLTRQWEAIHLENRYLRLVVLPELGGRIHIGYDKVNDYDFFYRNNVIKPALVGLAGPWISGGVEFNWPQHHRPATFLPVETHIELAGDGSATVWCSDHDPFARMKGAHGIRIHPGRSVIELVVRLTNRTSERQTFLWWANVAARVDENYQSFFPEDVRFVADHARRAITAFPAADRSYYGVDYPLRAIDHPGADRIDFYRNIPVPTSYMIVDTDESFFGGYDHGRGAGFVHWADRRIAPGKKQWTWGDAPFGHAWDRLLTDADGPYVELMAGVFTDNQPDFSWLMPGETKSFSQFWYPLPAIGVAHQANVDAAVNVSVTSDRARIAVTSTRELLESTLSVRTRRGETLFETGVDLVPGIAIQHSLHIPAGNSRADLQVDLHDREGKRILSWTELRASGQEPWVATEPARPEDIRSVDELYLTGLHLAQYRHPTRSPLPYWEEALERDPEDSRVNLAMADAHYRRGDYVTAIRHARVALKRITRRNMNPQDAEAYYQLGLALKRTGATQEAWRAFAKAAWDANWAAPAGLEMARISAFDHHDEAALADLDAMESLLAADSRRHHIRIVLLRRLGRHHEAAAAITSVLATDPLDTFARYCQSGHLPSDNGAIIDLAGDLAECGEFDAALQLYEQAATRMDTGRGAVAPIAHYLRAALLGRLGRHDDAARARADARAADRRRVFPHGLDAHDALVAASNAEPDDAVAASLLGMLLYANGRRDEAVELWNHAIENGLEDAVTLRNAGLAAFNVLNDAELAWRHYLRAQNAAPNDARLLFEVDQLALRMRQTPLARLERLEEALPLTLERDDLTIAYADLLIGAGRAAEALALIESREFSPWEGGEGSVLATWDRARTALGLSTETVPPNLGENRALVPTPAVVNAAGHTDYFATSLPEMLLFVESPRDDDWTPGE